MDVYARYHDELAQGGHVPSAALRRMLARMPEDVRTGFSQCQLVAMDGALDANNPTHHPINLRVTLFGLAYLVILGGRERRGRARRTAEREKHPLHTVGNLAFLAMVAVLGVILGYGLRTLVFEG